MSGRTCLAPTQNPGMSIPFRNLKSSSNNSGCYIEKIFLQTLIYFLMGGAAAGDADDCWLMVAY